ncbi:MAG: hypothetical protein J0M33_16140 [Anaerolineae bacterium]|nr:hypothetical protein [Anaerolineae bacterium]
MKSIRWGNWLKALALVVVAYFVTMYIFVNRFIMFSEVSIFDGPTGSSFFYYPPSQFFGEGMVFPAILIIGSGLWIILSLKASPRPIWPRILFVVGLVISFPAFYFGGIGGMEIVQSYDYGSKQVEDYVYRAVGTQRRGDSGSLHLLECDSIGLQCQVVKRFGVRPPTPSPTFVLRYEPSSGLIQLGGTSLWYRIESPP